MSAPFERSLSLLGQVGVRETGATGYVLFVQTPDSLVRLFGFGDPIPAEALLERPGLRPLLIFPLRAGGEPVGFISFSLQDRASASRAENTLGRLHEAIQTIWAVRDVDTQYRNLAVRASALETELIDSRIADRAEGLLANGPQPPVAEVLVAHVKNVLRPSSVASSLERIVEDLEDETEERRVTADAKAILQAAHAFSEEQAHTHLRLLSRQARKSLKQTALDVIANPEAAASAA